MLTTAHVLQQMRHELGGGDLSIELDKIGILNQAGNHLYSMHPWTWTKGRSALLDFRGSVDGTTATWTAASATLTQASGFTDYTFLSGDEITIIDGTGATTGVYKISSRTSANAIVIDGSIAAGNLATGDIEWRIDPQTIALPTDLRDIIHIASTSETGLYRLTLTTLQQILERRGSNAIITTPSMLYGAVVYNGSPPVPILEVWPSPGSNETGALRIFYRSRWATLTADSGTSSKIDIPDFVNDLYVWIARAYASGYERGDVASIHTRLEEIRRSPIFQYAKRSDGMIQPFNGKIRNGGAVIWRRPHVDFPEVMNMVDAPS